MKIGAMRIHLAEIREAAGLTQNELAKRWGYKGQRAISHIETRDDILVSNLVGYVKAACGSAELTVRVGEQEFTYAL